ncbi:capping protein-inhibiting regulator of actin dynamics isoform X2 [Hemicordylus capensis]|uniref:capping protein-inhibiting regulator of actin dynamics isoform X2 n=1 Tax=Hemicordylus capensis TaxID=884348 RepID=UPI002302CDEC|nr:capping protein-inhibiting regulator of actin dynamics isoform X2 [Hemicordylus capensis]
MGCSGDPRGQWGGEGKPLQTHAYAAFRKASEGATDKKKASKFQPFKKFFGRRRKREATPDLEDAELKPSNSFGNVCNGALSSDEETNDGLRSSSYSMGARAFSHDSIFIPDGRAESEESDQAMSQENILGKVKTLQQQLAKNIKFGQPPQMTVSVKAIGEANASSEADVLLSSPMETEAQQDIVLPENYNKSGGTLDSLSPASLHGTEHEVEEKVAPVKSSRPKRHHSPSGTIETVNLDAIPLAIARLDNSAAKHKLSVKPKNQRVSKKHRRLSKELQKVIVPEFEQEIPESQSYDISSNDGHYAADKAIHHREGKEQKAEGKRKQEDHWRDLETEKEIQMAGTEIESHLEHKRLQDFEENQREQDGKKQKLQEEEQFFEMEEGKDPEEKKTHKDQRHQDLQEHRHKDLEEQRRKEEGPQELKDQKQQQEKRHQELEEQKQSEGQRYEELEVQRQYVEHHELEAQRLQEEQRHQILKEQRHHELEAQRQHEEQRHQALEELKQREEQRHRYLEVQRQLIAQRHREMEEETWQEPSLKDQQRKQEKRHQELEGKKQLEKLLQQEKDKRHKQEKHQWQEEQQSHPDTEGQVGQELGMHETEKQDQLNQQGVHVQKRQTGQRQELEKIRNLESEEKLQGKERAMKLEKQEIAEDQQKHLEEEQKKKDEQKQQDLEKQMISAEHGHCELTELKQPWAEKRVQQEELIERGEGQKLEEQKTSSLEGQQPLRKPKEQNRFFPLLPDKNIHPEEKCLETIEKEVPPKEEARQQKIKQPDKGQKEEETLKHDQRKNIDTQEQERILGEELRWQEVDARQAMPRGFTFQVSSGEKQIIFQKVNLSPVTPVKEAPAPSATKELKTPKSSKVSHALQSSLCVPHTAILVTGAQLCGTAVNLNQIKDTACKSLLGLTEERKTVDVVPAETSQKMSPGAKPSSSKMKHPQDPLGNQAILAEWASIRSKILKSAENGKLTEKDKGSLSRHSDDWTPKGHSASHGNLRKTLSANAKFSITPAWQKFSEVSKCNTDAESKGGPEADNTAKQLGPLTDAKQEAVHSEALPCTINIFGTSAGKSEVQHEMTDNTEGCKFAKDLPSFLVPTAPHSPSKEMLQPEISTTLESQQKVGMGKLDRASPSGEEHVSPFGVKLRRTNYSLRFHYDQQAEQKKKKRYSAGDSFDGVPTPLVTPDNEKEANNIFLKENKSPLQERKDVIVSSVKDLSANVSLNYTTVAPVSLPTTGQVSVPSQEKPVCKSPLSQKPALAPKPISQTPPSSPLSKMRRSHLTDPVGQRVVKTESDTSWRKAEAKGSALLLQGQDESKSEEEESKERKSFFPSITMPWREKTEKKPEPLKKERPVLQSRHSIDGSKLMEKVETAQPLWITLALQKQKGFREQQATREERRQAREAKQAEKLAKENASINNQPDIRSSNISRTSTMLKPAIQEEEKKAETAKSRLERREQLKKSNTLPTSVTVEISDSVPSSPLAKEVTKRFSTPDANPVSTEPAWLALAKRKAKAWSDCPQIIK